jgi:hypothetical protein
LLGDFGIAQTVGDPLRYPIGRRLQGDAVRIYNYARCVNTGTSGDVLTGGDVPLVASTQPEAGVPGQAGPPKEAIEACTGLQVGVVCTVNTPQGGLTGSCFLVPLGELACIPEGGHPGGNQELGTGGRP